MFYIVLSICVCAIAPILRFISKWQQSRRPFYELAEKLPGPKSLPLLGNALTFMCAGKTELFSRTLNLISSHPRNMRFWLGPDLITVFADPDHVASILKSPKFNSKHDNLIYFQEYFGNGLISASGPLWKEHRKIIQPLFHQKFIRHSMEIVQKHADILIGKLQSTHVNSNKTFNVHRFYNYCAADLTSEILFGESLNTQCETRNRHLATVGEDLYYLTFERIMKVWLQPNLLHRFTEHRRKGLLIMKHADDYLTSVIEKSKNRVKEAASNLDADAANEGENDFIPPTVDMLTLYLEESSYKMNGQDFKHHLLSLYTAGEDPLTIALGFTCMLLGMNPQYQEIAAEEIRRVFGESPRTVKYDDLKELTYLERCIKEILRIVPIGPFILRQPYEDVQLGEYSIPKGCAVLIPVVRLHRDPDQWERPNDFYPDHFRPECVAKRHPCAYIPFSAGHRICIGQSLALASLKMLLANILQHFRIECDGKFSDIQLMSDLSIRPINGYNIRLFTK